MRLGRWGDGHPGEAGVIVCGVDAPTCGRPPSAKIDAVCRTHTGALLVGPADSESPLPGGRSFSCQCARSDCAECRRGDTNNRVSEGRRAIVPVDGRTTACRRRLRTGQFRPAETDQFSSAVTGAPMT
jgi:hypothetical protein